VDWGATKQMSKRKKDREIGHLFQSAAAKDAGVPMMFDVALGIRPDLGLECTIGDIAAVVEQLAAQFNAAGVLPGERVLVYKTHNPDIIMITCALSRAGAVPVLISPMVEREAAQQLIVRAAPTHVVTDADKIAAGDIDPKAVAEIGPTVLLTSGHFGSLTNVTDLAAAPIPEPPFDSSAPYIVTHTSGTTGLPKMVEQTAAGLQEHAKIQIRFGRALGIRERWAMCISFVHIRTYSALILAATRRMPLALMANHDLDSVRETFKRFKPEFIETHPNTFIEWEALAAEPERPMSSVKYFLNTFDAIHMRTVRRMLAGSDRRYPIYFQAYGQSESGPITVRPYTRLTINHADGRCVGYPIPGITKVRLARTEAAGPRPIEVRSAGVARTYVAEGERFAANLSDGWWAMGDVGHRSRWGCVHLLDRIVDQVDGLESVIAIEDTLMDRLEQLREVVIVSVEPDVLQPIICTRGDQPIDAAQWAKAISDLPPMRQPVLCRWDDLPTTATAKVKRIQLHAIVAEGRLVTAGQPALLQ